MSREAPVCWIQPGGDILPDDQEWRTDGHGSWYLATKLSTTAGLGIPGDLFECECSHPNAHPHAHESDCPVLIGWRRAGDTRKG